MGRVNAVLVWTLLVFNFFRPIHLFHQASLIVSQKAHTVHDLSSSVSTQIAQVKNPKFLPSFIHHKHSDTKAGTAYFHNINCIYYYPSALAISSTIIFCLDSTILSSPVSLPLYKSFFAHSHR